MQFTTSDQLQIHFDLFGESADPPLLLVHGIGADREMWRPQMNSLPAAGFRLIIPDLRGHGLSDIPADFEIADCARDLKELLDHLQVQQAHLVGVSMGGMVVQRFALDYPDQSRSLVIVDSLSGITRPVERFNGSLAALLLKILPTGFQARLISSTYQRMGHEQVGNYFKSCLLAMDPDWLLEARLEVNRFNILSELSSVISPTLVLVGDSFGKMALDMARTTAESIPDAKFQILEGGGDPSNLLVPNKFDRALLNFLHGQVNSAEDDPADRVSQDTK